MRNFILFVLAALAAFFYFLSGAFAAEPSFSATLTWSSNGASSSFKIDAAAIARVEKFDVRGAASWTATTAGEKSFSLGVTATPVEQRYRCDGIQRRTFASSSEALPDAAMRRQMSDNRSVFGTMIGSKRAIPKTFSEVALSAAEDAARQTPRTFGVTPQWRSVAPFAPGSIAGAREESDPASEIPRL